MLKNHSFLGWRRTVGAAAVAFAFLSMPTAELWAADNTATGDIGGVDADLTDSNTFTLNSSTLALVKAAFLNSSGAALSSGSSVPKGTLVDFLIYVDNTTGVGVSNVNISDPLTGFTYQADTIKVDNSQNTGATAAAIYASVDAQSALDDAVDGVDVAGISGSTISAGSGAGNAALNIAASKVWAILFTASVD
ncbi:MAG: hypothetical protein R3E97_04495 [Candidatus Eisenbacteria bacterium]